MNDIRSHQIFLQNLTTINLRYEEKVQKVKITSQNYVIVPFARISI
jgi:hypothetical protein